MNWRVLLGVLLAAAGAAALVKALLLPGVLLVAAGVALLLLWDAWRTAGAVLRAWRGARAWRPCLRAFSVRRPAYFFAVARSEPARSSR